MDFGIILQSPTVRAIVQENALERAFHDALFPNLMFRSEATPNPWPAHSGDRQIFTAPGLIAPKMRPLQPGQDPTPSTWGAEQWEASMNQYGDAVDVNMPTSMQAIADLFMRHAHQLGLSAGQALNRIVRNEMFAAALSGQTVLTAAAVATTSLRVARLNGFTRARRPTVAGASAVRFDTVSASNPLPITVGTTSVNVIGYTPDTVGDEVGPGTLTVDANVTEIIRSSVVAYDASDIVRAGGGTSIDALSSSDVFTLAAARKVIAAFRQNNVQPHTDGYYHAHIDPTSEAQVFDDAEFQRLNTSLPDYVYYREMAVGQTLGVVYLRNNENPIDQTVGPNDGVTFSQDDPFPGELHVGGVAGGVAVHRVLFSGAGAIHEYYADMNNLLTEAGVNGKIGDARVNNNGIDVNTDRIQLVIRAPMNRLQDQISIAWKFIGGWSKRTDSATGGKARFKRVATVEHGA